MPSNQFEPRNGKTKGQLILTFTQKAVAGGFLQTDLSLKDKEEARNGDERRQGEKRREKLRIEKGKRL